MEVSAPVQTQYRLEELVSLVKDSNKAANLRQAVMEYAVANNKTWPGADPVSYQMGWCDCEQKDQAGSTHACYDNPGTQCYTQSCPDGKMVVSLEKFDHHTETVETMKCCRPCFKN